MKLEEFQERRALVLDVVGLVDVVARVSIGDVEVRSAPSEEPGRTRFTITPTGDGTWRGDSWYSEFGGTHSIASIVAATPEMVLDWAWWLCAADYRAKYVVPAAEQYDRKTRRLDREFLRFQRIPELIAGSQKNAQLQWSDESTNSLLLGLAARMLARSTSSTAMRLARNPRTPPGALARMATKGGPAVRWQVAGNPATRKRALNRLRATADFGVRWYLATRDDTPTSDIVAWAAEDSALWSALLDRPDLTAAQLDDLDLASSGVLRTRIIGHPAATPLLGRFASECDTWLGIVLLESGRLEPPAIDVVVERAAGWNDWFLGSLLATRRLPFDTSTADRLARSGVDQARILAAASGSLSDSNAHLLTADPSSTVRKVLAGSPDLPATILARLAADSSAPVRETAVSNPTITPALLADLAADPSPMVRRAAIRHPEVPLDALQSLLDHTDTETARAARSAVDRR